MLKKVPLIILTLVLLSLMILSSCYLDTDSGLESLSSYSESALSLGETDVRIEKEKAPQGYNRRKYQRLLLLSHRLLRYLFVEARNERDCN